MEEIRTLLMSRRVFAKVGLRALLKDSPEIKLVGEAEDVNELAAMARSLRPSVLIADAMGQDSSIITAVVELMRRYDPTPGVLVLADEHDHAVQNALQAGANGLVLSQCTAQEFIAAVHLAAAGYRLMAPVAGAAGGPLGGASSVDRVRLKQLTDREFEVLQLIALGFGNAQISEALAVSESTVKTHVRNILVKLGLRNRVQTVIYAYEVGFVRIGFNQFLHGRDAAYLRQGWGKATSAA